MTILAWVIGAIAADFAIVAAVITIVKWHRKRRHDGGRHQEANMLGVWVALAVAVAFASIPFAYVGSGGHEKISPSRAAEMAKETIVRTCKPPIGRHPTDFVVRDDQGLWFVRGNERRRIADATNLNDICRPAGQSLLGRIW